MLPKQITSFIPIFFQKTNVKASFTVLQPCDLQPSPVPAVFSENKSDKKLSAIVSES